MKIYRNKGFTLIEIMVAVAIVAILAAIAIPNYSSYVVRGARSAAQTELLQLASVQEKIYLNSTAYATSITSAYDGTSAGGLGHASSTTADGKYNLAIVAAGQTYIITATPATGKSQAGNGCLTIRDNGLRQWHESRDACDLGSPTSW